MAPVSQQPKCSQTANPYPIPGASITHGTAKSNGAGSTSGTDCKKPNPVGNNEDSQKKSTGLRNVFGGNSHAKKTGQATNSGLFSLDARSAALNHTFGHSHQVKNPSLHFTPGNSSRATGTTTRAAGKPQTHVANSGLKPMSPPRSKLA